MITTNYPWKSIQSFDFNSLFASNLCPFTMALLYTHRIVVYTHCFVYSFRNFTLMTRGTDYTKIRPASTKRLLVDYNDELGTLDLVSLDIQIRFSTHRSLGKRHTTSHSFLVHTTIAASRAQSSCYSCFPLFFSLTCIITGARRLFS